eukprot:Gb_11110 [translate_table: standard]
MTRRTSGVAASEAHFERDCNIQEHLKNHVHLTNCIHLKNHVHMHKSKVMSAESSLMRDLIVLQRSRSLRDPSTSPSWNSPIIGSLMKRLEKEGVTQKSDFGGVRSLGGELRRELRRGFTTSPLSQSDRSRKPAGRVRVITVEGSAENDKIEGSRNKGIAYPHTDSRLGGRMAERNKKGLSDENWTSISEMARPTNTTEVPLRDDNSLARGTESDILQDSVAGNMSSVTRMISRKGVDDRGSISKRLSDWSKKYSVESPKLQSSHWHHKERQGEKEVINDEEAESGSAAVGRGGSILVRHSHPSAGEPSRPKKFKFKGMRRSHFRTVSREVEYHEASDLSVASNSLVHGAPKRKDLALSQGTTMQRGENELEVTQVPRHGCGIPWNWSGIHHRGKTILDLAGRSLSCGLSDSTTRKIEDLAPPQSHSSSRRDFSAVPGTSDLSHSSLDSDSEALPLLIEPGASQESVDTDAHGGKFSGELGLYGDHNLSFRQDSDSAYENRSEDQFGLGRDHESRGRWRHEDRHWSLTQKYAPKAFKELVGQNLVAQALSNAIVRGKIGLAYVFYGPHGTGKTSCARIFATALNCHSLEQSRPCGVCSSCLARSIGKSSDVKEIISVGSLRLESISRLLDNVVLSSSTSHYRVVIMDDCDTLTSEAWNAISKILDLIPRHVVFILVATNLDQLPHTIVTRCQKFFFPKLKDVDIITKLQAIAAQEGLEIDKDALKLIASKSDGSLRDAEMTLDQLSLLGQRISLPLVQELVGLIPDEKLVDLLDLALSADTVNTVKCLRELMEAGVDPLSLMPQLATLITDILAGSYKLPEERLRRKFFRREKLSKEEMERLRQALKTLSEAEKQLRLSNDRTTWLTAALLQLAPDQSYMLPSSSAGTSFPQSPIAPNYASEKEIAGKDSMSARRNQQDNRSEKMQRVNFSRTKRESITRGPGSTNHGGCSTKDHSSTLEGKKKLDNGMDSEIINEKDLPTSSYAYSLDINKAGRKQFICRSPSKLEDIWEKVLENIHSNALKQFMCFQGKLYSISFGAAPTAKLIFSHQDNKVKAEKYKTSILQAFQSALGCPIGIQIDCAPSKEGNNDLQVGFPLVADQSNALNIISKLDSNSTDHGLALGGSDNQNIVRSTVRNGMSSVGHEILAHEASKSEIVGTVGAFSSPQGHASNQHAGKTDRLGERRLESAWVHEAQPSPHLSTFGPYRPEKHRNTREHPRTQSNMKSKVSLGYVIQQAEGSADGFNQDPYQNYAGGWSKRKGISIAEKLEQENLRLESRSGGLLCWKAGRVNRKKVTHFRNRTRRPRFFLKLVCCAKCPCVKSTR